MTQYDFFQRLRHAIIESEDRNHDSHAAEVAFAEKVANHPEIVELRYRRVRRIVRLVGACRGILLDMGPGKCLNAVLAIACGAREVYAVEYEDRRFRSAALLGCLRESGLSEIQERVHLVHADVLELELPEERFDAAYGIEFLEHVANPVGLHRKTYSWLKPGGWVYYRTGANGANPLKVKSYADYWDRVDKSVLAPLRRRIIESLAPDLSPVGVEQLAIATRGLTEREICQTVNLWRGTGAMPESEDRHERVPRHPISGEYFERPVHPEQVLGELRSAGFISQLVRPDFSNIFVPGKPKLHMYRIAGLLVALTHPLSLLIAPWIEVVGMKPR